jgi:quercetin dioxygenase-like cupin family protein
LFENQYVRVYEVRIPPGETTDFHRHAFDSVAVFLAGGTTADQLEGRDWGKDATDQPGTVAFDDFSKHPITHRVRNDGKSEYRLILVQLLQ